MIESDHHPSLHADLGKLQPKLASYVNYLFAQNFMYVNFYVKVYIHKTCTTTLILLISVSFQRIWGGGRFVNFYL